MKWPPVEERIVHGDVKHDEPFAKRRVGRLRRQERRRMIVRKRHIKEAGRHSVDNALRTWYEWKQRSQEFERSFREVK